jgi:hypothetical protein
VKRRQATCGFLPPRHTHRAASLPPTAIMPEAKRVNPRCLSVSCVVHDGLVTEEHQNRLLELGRVTYNKADPLVKVGVL